MYSIVQESHDAIQMVKAGNETEIVDALYRISSLVNKTVDSDEALELILATVIEVLDGNRANIALRIPESEKLRIEVSWGNPKLEGEVELEIGQGIAGWVALHGKPLLVPDVRKDPRYFSLSPRTRSEIAVPMEERGAEIGVLNVESEDVDAFDERALKVLTLLSNEASKVIGRLWLIEQLRRRALQMEALIGMGQSLVLEIDLRELLQRLTRNALKITDCCLCALFLYEGEEELLRLEALADESGIRDHREILKLSDSAIGTAVLRKRQVEVLDLRKTEEHHFTELIQEDGLVSMLSTPILYEDSPIGVLNAYTDRPHRFDNEVRNTFATLASLGAAAIQNARLYTRTLESEEKLRRSDKLTTLGFLSAEIAHEIRNPLTVLKLLLESLDLNFEPTDPRHTDFNIIKDKLDHLESIVTRVLDFGRSDESNWIRLELHHLIQESLLLMRLKFEQSKVRVTFQREDPPIFVRAKRGQLEQVFLNLLLNAVQAMPRGGEINIHAYLDRREGNSIAVTEISDTGPGIPKKDQERIFESTLLEKNERKGLGLNIVKRIMTGHQGDIEITSSSSSGTTFTGWLPAEP